MLKVMLGVKGTGKTKTLIHLANGALEVTKGDVVCVEKGTNLRYDIKPTARLINVDEYSISDAHALYGFIAGLLASNHDITDLFIDGTLIICNNDVAEMATLVERLAPLAEKCGINMLVTVSLPEEEAPASIRKYL